MQEIDPILGKNVLQTVLNKPKNRDIFNKAIVEASRDIEDYKSNLYSICYQLKNREISKRDHREIFKDIKSGNLGWNNTLYQDFRKTQEEQDEFLDKPMDLEEGVNKCGKCGSKKTFSYTKQIRRADEGTTVFCMCSECGNRWKL